MHLLTEPQQQDSVSSGCLGCTLGIARIGDIMSRQVLRDSHGREVMRVVTESGVVGYIATCVSPVLMADMAAKLRRKLARAQMGINDPEVRASIARALDASRR